MFPVITHWRNGKKHGYFEEADKIGLEADQIAVRGRLPLQLHTLTSNIADYEILDRKSGEGNFYGEGQRDGRGRGKILPYCIGYI